jgi:hypothetical protein
VAVNAGVATQMGQTKVAVCLPGRLVIDGNSTTLADGGSLLLANDTVRVSRAGNSYLIRSQSGDSVSAVINASWIDVSVGLGITPSNAKGLLVNANGNVNQIAARDGTVLTAPFSFDELYGPYADSWRVPANTSLLSVCDEGPAATGVPTGTFYAGALNPRQFRHGLAICEAAGVKQKSLLGACILDVAVLGKDAAKVYVGAPAPAAVGLIVMRSCKHHRHHHHHHGFGHNDCGCPRP